MPEFKLDTERWIPVVWENGRESEVSLREVLTSAKEIKRLAGTPPEVAVLSRLLLAIAHIVRSPKGPTEWLAVWKDRSALLSDMEEYVRLNAGSFDLYDEARPFGQHPGLPVPSGTPALLTYDRARGNNPLFFDHSQVGRPSPIPSAQAARGLLVNHAFGGSHPGGNHPLTGKDAGSVTAGPLCARAIALLQGENLAKTIALNLASGRKAGRPAWARAVAGTPTASPSQGLADRYTRGTRFARLKPSEDGALCLAVSFSVGEPIPGDEDSIEDPTIPRYLAKDKKVKPWRLSQDRAAWRSADVLLVTHIAEPAPPLIALEQLRPLVSEDAFPADERVSLRILGVLADAQGPSNTLWRDETLRFDLSVVADDARYEALRGAIEAADGVASRLRGRLFGFAKAYLAGADGNPDPKDCGRLSDEIAPDLAEFWSVVGPEGERIALDGFDPVAWQKTLQAASDAAFRKAVDRLPVSARRFRAEYVRPEKTDDAKPKAKAGKK